MSNKDLKISILTPSFNSGEYIERAIKSVLSQDYSNFEHIIVDGGSTDKTLSILKNYSHIKWISEKDAGQSDAMNKAFKLSTGDIIVYLNADDYFVSNIFKSVVELFHSKKETYILVGNLYRSYNDPNKLKLELCEYQFNRILLHFKYNFPFNPVCYFYKREVQSSFGDFPINEHYVMDFWFILNVFISFKVTKTDLVLGYYFDSGHNKSSQNSKDYKPKMAKTFLKHHPELRFYYYSNKIFDRLLIKIPRLFADMCKYFIAIAISRKKRVSFAEYKQKGFKYLIKNK